MRGVSKKLGPSKKKKLVLSQGKMRRQRPRRKKEAGEKEDEVRISGWAREKWELTVKGRPRGEGEIKKRRSVQFLKGEWHGQKSNLRESIAVRKRYRSLRKNFEIERGERSIRRNGKVHPKKRTSMDQKKDRP